MTHRIHIVGGPGSGKTTLSRQLGAHLSVPVYEIDAVAEQAAAETLLLPLYAGLTDAEQDTVVAALRRALG